MTDQGETVTAFPSPFLIRQRRRACNATARFLRAVADRLAPPPEIIERARAAGHPSVVDLPRVRVVPGRPAPNPNPGRRHYL